MMDVAAASDVNGGNAEVAREDSNLERSSTVMPESPEKPLAGADAKMDDVELNGDIKSPTKKMATSPAARRKLRKFKANSTAADNEAKSPARVNKRKPSDLAEVSSGESEEFNGFDNKGTENFEPSNLVLKKLIGDCTIFILFIRLFLLLTRSL